MTIRRLTPATVLPGLTLVGALAVLAIAGCGGGSDTRTTTAPTPAGKPVAAKPLPDARHDGTMIRSGSTVPFEFSWDVQLPAPVHTAWFSPELPELYFVQTETNEIHAIDVMSGHTKWVSMALPKPMKFPAAAQRVVTANGNAGGADTIDDRVYVISENTLYVLDGVYGQVIWSFDLPFEPCSGPEVLGSGGNLRVYIGDWAGRVQCVTLHPEKQRPYVLWQWNTRETVHAQPIGLDESVYAADTGGDLSCFGLDRELRWEFDAKAALYGSVCLRGQSLYIGGSDNVLHVLNRHSGKELGTYFLGAPVKREPWVFNADGNRLYVWTDSREAVGGLHALHTMPDTIKFDDPEKFPKEVERLAGDWYLEGYTRLVASSPDFIYLMKPEGTMIDAVRRSTGKVEWSWDVNEGRDDAHAVTHITEYQDPADNVRTIFTADATGHLVTYRLFGQPALMSRSSGPSVPATAPK